ncbi:MAG: PKD domain-containing protein [Bacteroidetes bacterium]|nr:PKD domain-containing protein [Bacteroidota bacterium]
MKAVLHVLLGLVLLTTAANAQNVFNPNDPVYTYNANSAAGSNTNPNTPPTNTMAKWVRTVNRINWDATKFKCYYFNGMAFRLRFPNNYDASGNTKYPILIFFHGGGEIGPVTDNEDQLYWGAQVFEQRINNNEWNGFMLFPQETSIGWDDSYFSRVNNILDTLQKYNNLDPDRSIAMGLSSGGYGCIAFAQNYPARVATVISSSPEAVNSLNDGNSTAVHIPVWLSNGGLDQGPNPYQANAYMVNLRNLGGKCYQTYLADEGHATVWSIQWALTNSANKIILDDWWNSAHKAQPLVFYGNDRFCTGSVNAKLGISAGFFAYEWQYDGGGGFSSIGGATSNEYQATQAGKYRVRFQRTSGSAWSAWTPNPVVISEKACSADTLYAEHFEASNTFYYAAASYKPNTFDCQNGVITSSTYNITQDASGKTGGQFLLHNTAANGCTYTATDQVWRSATQVNVTPNTNYEYVFYLANRSTSNNARIVPTINGQPLSTYVQATGSGNSSWTRFRYVWNSGNNTIADLALQNQVTATSGNDFAIDDISFGTPPPNASPVANAGADISIQLPVNNATLNGNASYDPDGSISAYAWTKISGPAQSTLTNGTSATAQLTNLVAGTYSFRLQVTDNGGFTAADTVNVVVSPTPPCGALPSGVSTTDVGNGGLLGIGNIATGSACYAAPNTYDIKGAGDLVSMTDKFRYVYRSFSGDGVMVVKLAYQDAVNAQNKAGLMFRTSLSSGSDYVFMGLSSGNGAYLQSQTLLGLVVSTTNTGAGTLKAPYYLKLVRSGSTFTGYVSPDSVTWTSIGSKTVSMSTGIYAGLAVCSHSSSTLSEAVFTGWTSVDANSQGRSMMSATEGIPSNLSSVETSGLVSLNGALKVYPNPAPAGFAVEFGIETKQDVFITVTSGADGRTCYTETLRGFSGHYSKDFGFLHLPKGSYAVTLHTATGVRTVLVVKQ